MQLPNSQYHALLDSLNDGIYMLDNARKIQYWNAAAERITGFSAAEVLGRSCSDSILTHVDESGATLCRGLCPVALAMTDGQPREARIYLHHRNGHRLPVTVRVLPLRDESGAIVGAAEVFVDGSTRLAAMDRMQELERLALFDPLTELANRRYLEMEIHNRLAEVKRYGWPFGVILADIDHFKKVNDQYGHNEGDQVLRATARTLSANARPFDLYGRWGGDEFVGVIRNVGADALRAIAERMRRLIESCYITTPIGPLRVTISVGAALVNPEDDADTLLKRADRLLYRSKEAGRNRMTLENEAARGSAGGA